MTATGLLLRADAGPAVGLGHLMRCLALALTWRERLAPVTLIAPAPSPSWVAQARQAGIDWLVPAGASGSPADAAAVVATLQSGVFGWVVVDGYGFGAAYLEQVRACGVPVVIVDDDGSRQTLPADRIVVPDGRSAWLRPAFAAARARSRVERSFQGRLLLTLGGSDPADVTGQCLEALQTTGVWRCIEVLVGRLNPHVDTLQARAARDSRVTLHVGLDDPVPLMAQADLALTASGSTVWELGCLGVPMVVLPTAANQTAVADTLRHSGAAVVVPDVASAVWSANVLAADGVALRDMARSARSLCDGRGAARVMGEWLQPTLRLKPASVADRERLWHWANEPLTRQNSFHTEPIAWETHDAWLDRRLADAGCRIWIACVADGVAVGQVRVEADGDSALVSISLDPAWRACGMAVPVLQAGLQAWRQAGFVGPVEALIKPDNGPSRRLFERAGFREAGRTTVAGQPAVRLYFAHPPWS